MPQTIAAKGPLAAAVLGVIAQVPISRWQRDLTDSTVIRNMGVAFGYSYISFQAILKGLNKLELNTDKIDADINSPVLLDIVHPFQFHGCMCEGIQEAYQERQRMS